MPADGNDDNLLRNLALFVLGSLALAIFAGYLAERYYVPRPYDGATLDRNTVYISARRFETHGLERIASSGTGNALSPWRVNGDAIGLDGPVIVLVHGYNAQEHKVASYFAGMTRYLRDEGRFRGTLVVFDWPARGVPFDELPTAQRVQLEMMSGNRPTWLGYEGAMYSVDQNNARTVGARSFLALLETLRTINGAPIVLVGHSMGCYVLAHALQTDAAAFSRVARMIWLAPDVDTGIIGEAWFKTALTRHNVRLEVHFSRNDVVLSRASRAANLASRLGHTGPPAGTPEQPSLQFVDMTEDLQGSSVHGAYLQPGSKSLHKILSGLSSICPDCR